MHAMDAGAMPGGRRIVIRRARLFDSPAGVFRDGSTIVVEGDRVVEATQEPIEVDDAAVEIDAAGRAVLPGLIDAHVHVAATSHDLIGLTLKPPSLVTAESAAVMRTMLHRGFTTVRDAAGADHGLQTAVARGLFEGPRLFIAVQPISQTGGHADMRPQGLRVPMHCACAGLGLAGAIADGVGEVRRAVREQVRQGANQIKIMAGGGVSSPTDPIDGTQFSVDELRAAVEEAEAANLYALAHAYSPRAVTRAVQAGVRSIEHGNLIDEATAREMKRAGAYLVPTLSTYAALADEGQRLGWSAEMLAKLEHVRTRGLEAVRIARAEGVPVVFGTDLLGHMHERQSGEFALRASAVPPLELLQSATVTAARLMRREGEIGALVPGAFADLLIVDGDPAASLGMLADPRKGLWLVMQGGRTVLDRLAGPAGPAAPEPAPH
jgi:imidazolonepropionase-like amidohydrolase